MNNNDLYQVDKNKLQEVINSMSQDEVMKLVSNKMNVNPQIVDVVKNFKASGNGINPTDVTMLVNMIKPYLSEDQQQKINEMLPMVSMFTMMQGMNFMNKPKTAVIVEEKNKEKGKIAEKSEERVEEKERERDRSGEREHRNLRPEGRISKRRK